MTSVVPAIARAQVKTEVKAETQWRRDWGEVFLPPAAPVSLKERLAKAEAQLATSKGDGGSFQSNAQMSFIPCQPFREFKVGWDDISHHPGGLKAFPLAQIPVAGATSGHLKTTDPDEVLGSSGCAMP